MTTLAKDLLATLSIEIDDALLHPHLTIQDAIDVLEGLKKKVAANLVNDFGVYPAPDTIEQVREFHQMTNCPVLQQPLIPPADRCALRVKLIRSETDELIGAIAIGDIVGVADALIDLQYVVDGAMLEFGLTYLKYPLFNEVHRSNMSKGCLTYAEAQETVDYLAAGNVAEYGPIQCDILAFGGKFIIVAPGGKIMKPLGYSKADLPPILFGSNPGNV